MLKNLFNKGKDKNTTGIYVFKNSKLIELEETPGNGSINSIIESIGFATNQIHTVHTFNSRKIEVLGFKIFSKDVLFVLAKKNKTISGADILKEKKQIDWQFEYSSLNIEDFLNDGIEAQNLSYDFLSSVLKLTKEENNLFKSEKFDLYLQFENNLLQALTSSEWENSSSKWLKGLNETMFQEMVKEAKKYHENDIDTMEEVNNHANSLLNIPEAMNNEFIPIHTKGNGNINFYNLLIAHYTQDCELDDFIFMNKGRYNKIDELNYQVGNFVYEFNYLNELESIYEK